MLVNRVDTHIIPFPFEYHAPTSLEEAVELLSKLGAAARPLAGGTDLLVQMKQRRLEPGHIVDVKRIRGLDGIEEAAEGVRIGAAARLRAIERSGLVRSRLPLLLEAVSSIGSVQVRSMATLGGNLCNASPAADSAVALLALGAEAHIAGPAGARKTPLEEFFAGPGETCLGQGELLSAVSVPTTPEGCGTCFIKRGRTSLDVATVNVAVAVRMEGEIVGDCRIALGAVAPKPTRARRAEEALRGAELDEAAMEEAAESVADSISPITDIRATAEYRMWASKALTRDALRTVRDRARRRG